MKASWLAWGLPASHQSTFEVLEVAHEHHETYFLFVAGVEIDDAEQVLFGFEDFFADLNVLVTDAYLVVGEGRQQSVHVAHYRRVDVRAQVDVLHLVLAFLVEVGSGFGRAGVGGAVERGDDVDDVDDVWSARLTSDAAAFVAVFAGQVDAGHRDDLVSPSYVDFVGVRVRVPEERQQLQTVAHGRPRQVQRRADLFHQQQKLVVAHRIINAEPAEEESLRVIGHCVNKLAKTSMELADNNRDTLASQDHIQVPLVHKARTAETTGTAAQSDLAKAGKTVTGKERKAQKAKEVTKVKAVKKEQTARAEFMTPERCEKMKNILMKIKDYTNIQLKDLLRKNNQSMTGNKTELLGKVAEGMLFGRTPKCPNCNGGRPRLDMATGVYHCSGYYEDQNFFQCDATFEFDALARQAWLN